MSIYFKGFVFFLLSLILMTSCHYKKEVSDGDKIAQVGDNVLSKQDIRKLLKGVDVSKVDTLSEIKEFVKHWLESQMLQQQAAKNLNDDDKANIDKMVEDYRTLLMVHKYEQYYIASKLDTQVQDSTLLAFYHSFDFDFRLKEPLLKVLWVKIPMNARKRYTVYNLMRADIDKNYLQIEELCKENSFEFKDFDEEWVGYSALPDSFGINEAVLKYKNFFKYNDSTAVNYLRILEHLSVGDTIPYSVVKNRLKEVIIHKRKKDLLLNLQHNAYAEALKRKAVYIKKSYILDEY